MLNFNFRNIKCYVSKRNGTKGWFLKLNEDPVLEMTKVIYPNARK